MTYTSTEICALRGSTVKMHCKYRYPPRIDGNVTMLEKTVWFVKKNGTVPVDLKTEAEYADRVQYHCGENECTLMIEDLRESDSAEYKFSFLTNQPGGIYTAARGVLLSVTGKRFFTSDTKSVCHQWTALTNMCGWMIGWIYFSTFPSDCFNIFWSIIDVKKYISVTNTLINI